MVDKLIPYPSQKCISCRVRGLIGDITGFSVELYNMHNNTRTAFYVWTLCNEHSILKSWSGPHKLCGWDMNSEICYSETSAYLHIKCDLCTVQERDLYFSMALGIVGFSRASRRRRGGAFGHRFSGLAFSSCGGSYRNF